MRNGVIFGVLAYCLSFHAVILLETKVCYNSIDVVLA